MADKKRPNVVGKGPALAKEIVEIITAVAGSSVSDTAKEKIVVPLQGKADELTQIIKMAYLKTVKAGEVTWDLKEDLSEMKAKLDAGDEAGAVAATEALMPNLEELIHKTKTFVVRMT
jgi:cob(I)alamin adenosyltransferase